MDLAGFPAKDGDMILKEKKRTLNSKGVSFTYNSLYYYCPEDKHHYTTTELDTENLKRAKKAHKEAIKKL